MNVNQFVANTSQLASPARFMVMFGKMTSIFPRPLLMRCNLTSLPGFSMGIMERKVYGPNRKFPISQNYQELTMSFYCSPDHKERAGFEKWFSKIYDKKYFDFGFYNDYIDTINIIQLGWDGKQTYKMQLLEAYPNLISPIELDYSQQNAFERFDVSFVYHRYQEPSGGAGNPLNLLPAALSGLGASLPGSLTGFLGDLPSNLLGGLTGPLSGILGGGGGLLGDVLGGVQSVADIVGQGADFVDSIVGAVNESAATITGLINDINAVSGIVGVTLIPPSIANGIYAGVNSVNSTLGNAANFLDTVATGAQRLVDLPNQVATGLLTGAGSLETSINNAFSGAVNAINIADVAVSNTLGILSEAEITTAGIVQPFVDAASGIQDLISGNETIAQNLKGLFDANIY